jgi:hypothetical protein
MREDVTVLIHDLDESTSHASSHASEHVDDKDCLKAIDTKLSSINTLDSKMGALDKKVTELGHQFTIEMRDLKHSLTVDMKDVSKEVSGEIHEGIEAIQKTLSNFLFRGAILVCLLIFTFFNYC